MFHHLGQVAKKRLNILKKSAIMKESNNYKDKGHDKLFLLSRDFVVGENEEKNNLLLPFE